MSLRTDTRQPIKLSSPFRQSLLTIQTWLGLGCLLTILPLFGCDSPSKAEKAQKAEAVAGQTPPTPEVAAKKPQVNSKPTHVAQKIVPISEFRPKDIHCKFDPVEPAYLLGTPIRLSYVLGFRVPHLLKMTWRGTPRALQFQLFDSQGQEINSFSKGIAVDGVPSFKRFELNPNSKVRLMIDLAKEFPLNKPGNYTLQASTVRGEKVASLSFAVIDFQKNNSVVVHSHTVEDVLSKTILESVKTYRLATGVVKDNKKDKLDFLRIDQIVKNKSNEEIPIPEAGLLIPRDAKLVSAELDCLDQLWWILESKGKQTLEIYDLKHHQRRTLIPWTTELLLLDAVEEKFCNRKKLVAGGKCGGVLFSTYTVNLPNPK